MNDVNTHETEDNQASALPEASESVASGAETAVDPLLVLREELERSRTEAAAWQDKYLRKLAEFDNARKRMRQESELLRQVVTESVLLPLLPVMDDFDRMLENPAENDDPFRRGAELIRDKLRAFLESYRVEKFECVGKPFDPELHDALMTRPTAGFPAGTVLHVITPGYRIGDRILRHAQVVVSAEPEGDKDGGGD
jgi:molecular chaperone GrpE